MRLPTVRLLLLAMLVCATVAGWVAMAGFKAKQCIDGQLAVQRGSDWRGAEISAQGCEVRMASGDIVLVPISAPPFEAGVVAVFGFIVLGLVAVIVVVRRTRRPPDRVA